MGLYGKLRFPSVDKLVRIILRKKREGTTVILLFKRDLWCAYRQLIIDIGQINLLGYWFLNKFYFDVVMAMGLISAARCCQLVTDMITYIFSESEGYEAVNYIDDFGGAECKDKAWNAFLALGRVISDVGMTEAPEKAVAPTSIRIFLGLEVNSIELTLKIPAEKLDKLETN